jgi:hypothetical protein
MRPFPLIFIQITVLTALGFAMAGCGSSSTSAPHFPASFSIRDVSSAKLSSTVVLSGLKMNDSGTVLEQLTSSNGAQDAVIYSNGAFTDLNTLFPGSTYRATDINANGDVVGVDQNGQGFLLSGGKLTTLPKMNGQTVSAGAINNKGDIAGASNNVLVEFNGGSWHALVNLPPEGASPQGPMIAGINDSGAIAVNTGGGIAWNGNVYINGALKPIPQAAAFSITANGINSGGACAVSATYYSVPPPTSASSQNGGSAFAWTPVASLFELLPPGKATFTAAGAINDNGEVVGTADGSLVIWSRFVAQGETPQIQGLSGMRVQSVGSVSNHGQICCLAIDASQAQHVLILTPTS